MVRKRVGGRFVSTKTEETAVAEEKPVMKLGKAPRPRFCRVYARARFAEAMPEISRALLKEAKKGSVAHLKLLLQLSGLDKEVVPRKTKVREKSLEEILNEQWEKDKAEEKERGEQAPYVSPIPVEFDF